MVDREREYDYQPYFTNSGTGKLFRSPKNTLTDEERWPRGYSRERKRAVEARMPDTYATTHLPDYAWGPKYHPELEGKRYGLKPTFGTKQRELWNLTSLDEAPDRVKEMYGRGRAAIRDAVARSDLSPKVLDTINSATFVDNLGPDHQMSGVYLAANRAIMMQFDPRAIDRNRQGTRTDGPSSAFNVNTEHQDAGGQTFIHELGHATDPKLDHLRAERRNDLDEGDRGRAERRADDFAVRHFVADPRSPYAPPNEVLTYPAHGRPGDRSPDEFVTYRGWEQRNKRALKLATDFVERHEGGPRLSSKIQMSEHGMLDNYVQTKLFRRQKARVQERSRQAELAPRLLDQDGFGTWRYGTSREF